MVNTSVEVRYLLADFSRMTSVLRTIEKIKSEGLLFDVVILNAGVLLPKERNTEDGFETTFQVNYLAQYQLLIAVIQNQTRRKAPMTVITVNFRVHFSALAWFRVMNCQ